MPILASGAPPEHGVEVLHRPYHSKRAHRKSRLGCRNCKQRKVKCNEARPVCRACTLRKEDCVYVGLPATHYDCRSSSPDNGHHAKSSDTTTPPAQGNGGSDTLDSTKAGSALMALTQKPMPMPAEADESDMQLLRFYKTTAWVSFSIDAKPLVDEMLRVQLVQLAFANPFLMNSILAMTALHLQHLEQSSGIHSIAESKTMLYRARAFDGYRKAIDEAKPETFPALLACSLILCAVSSQNLRDEDAKPLCIVDWIVIWRGIGLIIGLVPRDAIMDTGLAQLFMRPEINLELSAQHAPNNLLFMVSSIKDGDTDFPHVEAYYTTVKYLGALYRELKDGFSKTLDLRIVVFFTFPPRAFIDMCQLHRPRAMVIIAHYLVFAKLVQSVWWMLGISDREIRNISTLLGPEWEDAMRVPRAAAALTNVHEIARLLLESHTWEPPSKLGDEGRAMKGEGRTSRRRIEEADLESGIKDGQIHFPPLAIRPKAGEGTTLFGAAPSPASSPAHSGSSNVALTPGLFLP